MFEVPASEDVGGGGTTTCAVTDEIASGSPDAVATAVRFAAPTCCSNAAADNDGEGWDVVGHSRMKVEVDAPPDVLDELLAP